MAAEPRPSLAAVLFTDLVGSTALRASLGEEAADQLRKVHDRLLGERVEANAGQVVKGLGDGLMAVFASASDALTAAVEAQQAICVHNVRADAIAPLSVRMGLSVGDVSWEGAECFGTPAVEAARLVAVAAGGQIVCTDFVRVMARGRGGHRFRPLGALELKGLPEPVSAAEVEWEPPDHLSAERMAFPRSLLVRSPLAFVGRSDELAAAERHLDDADGPGLLWLVGEPGIGKTRLAAEIARRSYDRGWDVLAGRCDEDLDVPFQPFLQTLRDFVASTPTAALPARLGRQPGELARLLPELSALLSVPPPAPSADPAAERYRLFEAVRSWLAAAAGVRALLVVLDDLHWADGATVALLAYLVRSAEPAPLRIVATRRDTEPGTPELGRLIDDAAPAATTIRLAGLEAAGISRLVEEATGRSQAWDATGLARQIQQETGGNPLFVAAVLAGLEPGTAGRGLPGSVAAAVRSRMSRLPTTSQELLRVAAICGLEFDLRVPAGVLGLAAGDALEAAEAATRGHLAEEVGVNHYRFAHALVRDTLREELGRSRTAHYHGLVGETLESLFPDRLDDQVDALAYHFGEAVTAGGSAERALRYTLQAARRAAAQYAIHATAQRYRRALELLDAAGAGERTRCEVLVALGKAEAWFQQDFETGRTTLREAFAAAEQGSFIDLMVEAAGLLEVSLTFPGVPAGEAVALARRTLDRLDPTDSAERARMLTSLGRALRRGLGSDESVAILNDAVAMARRVGDDRTLAEALVALVMAWIDPQDVERRLATVAEALDIARESRDPLVTANAAQAKVFTLLEAGRMGELRVGLTELEKMHRDLPLPWAVSATGVLTGTIALVEGRFDDAEALAAAARDGALDVPGVDPDGIYGLQMFGIRREQGRLGSVAPALRTLARAGADADAWRPGLAALHAELSMVDEARAGLAALVTADEVLVPMDSRRSISLSYLADAATFLGDAERATALYRELLPYAEVCVVAHATACYGPTSRYLGMLATVTGRFDAAEAHFEDALVRCNRLESPVWRAHTQYQFARLLLTRRGQRDTSRAEVLARAAQETAARLGMLAVEERAGRLLESGLELATTDG